MNVAEIMSILKPTGIAVGIIILGKLIKIKSLDVDLLGWIGKEIGKALNKDVMEKIEEIKTQQDEQKRNQEEISKKLDKHISLDLEEAALARRKEILRFARETMNGVNHTLEGYQQSLEDADFYQHYCDTHNDFLNNRAEAAIKFIKEDYMERIKTNNFLGE